MPSYEHVFLARQDISAQQVDALVQSFRGLLEERGGQVGKTEYWGLKSLTYRIKKNRKAHFALMNIDAPHEAVAEMERQMRLSTDIIRFLTVRVDELDPQPSAMMRRSDRDERDGRGDRGDRRGGRRDRDFAPRETRDFAEVVVETEETGGEEDS
jgi:small subunit ribosomal protein S6